MSLVTTLWSMEAAAALTLAVLYGVVWTVDQTAGTTALRAFDAADISRQLWSGGLDGNDLNHFQVPTVADGKVFVGGQHHLEIYGLSP